MSKQVGLIKLKGNIGGISFYQSQGQDLARTANGPSKERIHNDPAFKRTRENNSEFGGSATAAKSVRVSLATVLQTMGEARLTSRLTRIFKDICNKDTAGVRGQRAIKLSGHTELLINLEFNQRTHFSSVFDAPFTFTNNVARDQGTITIPDFLPANFIQAPAGATHFQVLQALGVVSNYTFDVSTSDYEPTDPTLNTLGVVVYGTVTDLASVAPVHFALVNDLPGPPTMTPSASVLQCLGIQFFQRIGATDYLLAQGNCMKVVNVF